MKSLTFEGERYVRLYTRDTVEWDMLPWQARAVYGLLRRKLDRAGIIELGKYGARGLATTLKMPAEVVEPGLAGLLEDGWLELHGTTLVDPYFIEAEEAVSTEASRQRASRERARDLARAGSLVTLRDELVTFRDASVTFGDETVTDGHTTSHDVTPYRTLPPVPCLAVPSTPSDLANAREGSGEAPSSSLPRECSEGAQKLLAIESALPRSKNGKKPQSPEQREQERQLRLDAEELVSYFESRWIAVEQPINSKGPTLTVADREQGKQLVKMHGLVEAKRFVDAFLTDSENYVKGHPLRLLPGRVDRYRSTAIAKTPNGHRGGYALPAPDASFIQGRVDLKTLKVVR